MAQPYRIASEPGNSRQAALLEASEPGIPWPLRSAPPFFFFLFFFLFLLFISDK
jgi:hypothetical protein